MKVTRAHPPAGDRLDPRVKWDVPIAWVSHLADRFPAAMLRPVTLIRAVELDRKADATGNTRVWLALESLQVTGSFKVRGALVALAEARREHGTNARVVAASAGNHGAGVAYAAKVQGLRATVVMPASAPSAKRARVERSGAELVLLPSTHYDDAEAHGIALGRETEAIFVSPYDDPFVAAGNGGSLGFEIARALGRVPELVVCPFGGGGLASGLGWAFDEVRAGAGAVNASGQRRVWGVQSEASPAMALSLARGSAVTRLEMTEETLAEGLEGGISEGGFARARPFVAGVVVVSESEIASAMAFALHGFGIVLEGSAATALVPLLRGLPEELRSTSNEQDLVAVLTGRNVDRERLLRLPRNED